MLRYFIIHPVTDFNIEFAFSEHDSTTNEIISVLSGPFADVYPEFLKQYHENPLFLDNLSNKRKLDNNVDNLGYAPLSDRHIVSWQRLARILLPHQSHFENTELEKWAQSFSLATSDPSPLWPMQLVSQLLYVISILPLTTLQTMADAYPDWIVFQEILHEWILLRMHKEGKREGQVKVIHELAFRPVARFASLPEIDETEEWATDINQFDEYCHDVFWQRTHDLSDVAFEERSGQLQMIKSVAKALSDDQLLIIEAGTGTGKSLAYLMPSALFSTMTGEKVLIATHTIALQEQLRKKDIPIMQSLLEEKVNVAILKGRNHYLCMRKLSRHLRSQGELTIGERDFIFKIAIWISDTEAGDREEISLVGNETDNWRLIQSETETCINKKCPFFKHCYYFSARQKAAEAHLVLANHSLVLSDLATDHRILPSYQRLVIDEAHHLEDQATQQFGAEVTQFEMQKIMERIAGARGILPDLRRSLVAFAAAHDGATQTLTLQVEQLQRLVIQTMEDMKAFWIKMSTWVSNQSGKTEIRITQKKVEDNNYKELKEATNWLAKTRKQLAQSHMEWDQLRTDIEVDDPLFDRLEDTSGRIKELLHGQQICIDVALAQLPEADYVGWVTVRESSESLSLHLAPLSVSRLLKRELFEDKSTVILTSATLAVASTFEYLKDRTGLALLKETGRVIEQQVASPFSYSKQALLCVPIDLPDVKTEPAFTNGVADAIIKIATLTQGRTMVLFTSKQMLREVHNKLEIPLLQMGITTLAQGIHDHRRTRLLEQFKSSSQTVLLGLDSFWEGVDVQGDALTSLIIVKLPFPVPSHPIIEARSELIRQNGKQPFREYSIPKAVIRFTQGFGRLIRAKSDHGVVFVLDKRIITERYGRLFLDSLPTLPILDQSLEAVCMEAKKYIST